jgi:uncharacterized protein (TIGR03066 family)
MRIVLGCALAVLMAGIGLADDKKADKIDAKKLVGKWEPKNSPEGVSAVIDFQKDGKVVVNFKSKGKEGKLAGTYKVEGNKLTTTMSFNGKDVTETETITKLTDAELVTKDEKGKEETLLRIKGKKEKK